MAIEQRHNVPSEEGDTWLAAPVSTLMTRRITSAGPNDAFLDAAARMAEHGIRHLPVVDASKHVVGILSDRDVRDATGQWLVALHAAHESERVAGFRVAEVMTTPARTIGDHEPLSSAARTMVERAVGALVVVDGDGVLVGILSYTDLLRQLFARSQTGA